MWAALALTTVLTAPAQAGDLKVSNVRSTYGILGPTRKDKDVLPGDLLVVACDVENFTVQTDGTILYSMGLELTKKGKSKPEFKVDPRDSLTMNNLGGSTMPVFPMTFIGAETPPGDYILKVTIGDRGVKPVKTTTLEYPFKVKPVELGFVRLGITNAAGEPIPPVGVPGQSVWLHYSLVGYKLDANGNPNVTIELRIYEGGAPTLKKPLLKGDIIEASKESPNILFMRATPIQFNRAGKFQVVLKVTDNLAKTTKEQSLDLEVLAR